MILDRVTYFSRPKAPPWREILSIVSASDRNNAALGCSGVLGWGNPGYFQVIEGPKPVLAKLFAAIEADPRHVVVWQHWVTRPDRLVTVDLPMGFIEIGEHGFAPEGTHPAAFLASFDNLIAAARAKYPSAVREARAFD